MIELDEDRKLAKLRKFQAQISKDVEKKNRPKMWEEVDDIEKQERQILFSDDELSPQSKKKKIKKQKPDKRQQKLKQVAEYEKGLIRHRSEKRQYHDPMDRQSLNMDIIATIKTLQDAKQQDKDIPLALKKIGIKSLKTLFIGGAKKQFDIVLRFLKDQTVPKWAIDGFKHLMNKKPNQFKGNVRDLVRQFDDIQVYQK